jgi:hypothetical protein
MHSPCQRPIDAVEAIRNYLKAAGSIRFCREALAQLVHVSSPVERFNRC